MTCPKVSIVILNWNGRLYLKDCLSSVFSQSYPNYEVILVDNGSEDGSVDYVRDNFPNTKLIVNAANLGFSRGNNIGIRAAKGKYIATLNNDTRVDRNWVQELVKVAEADEKVGSCQAKIVSFRDRRIIDAVGIRINKCGTPYQIGYGEKDEGQYENVSEVFGACACAALYRKEMLDHVGLFDEDFFTYYEDVDLAWRARLLGWRCVFVPTSLVYHIHSATGRRVSGFTQYYLARNRFWLLKKHATWRQFACSLLWFLFTDFWFTSGVQLIYHRSMKDLLSFYKGIRDGLLKNPGGIQ